MAQAEHVIMQFVVQSAKHHVNPYYYHSGGSLVHYNLYHLKDAKTLSLSAKASINAQTHLYAARHVAFDKYSIAKTTHW